MLSAACAFRGLGRSGYLALPGAAKERTPAPAARERLHSERMVGRTRVRVVYPAGAAEAAEEAECAAAAVVRCVGQLADPLRVTVEIELLDAAPAPYRPRASEADVSSSAPVENDGSLSPYHRFELAWSLGHELAHRLLAP